MADVVEVLLRWQAGQSARWIARSLGMGRDRVRAIVTRAEAAGFVQHGAPLTREQWCEHAAEVFVDRTAASSSAQRQQLERIRETIEAGLLTNTATTVWQRLRDERGLEVGLTTFRRYVRQLRGVDPERVTVRMPLTAPGEVAEVDYAQLGAWIDPRTNKRFKVYAFVMTLCFSRMHFVDVVFGCDQHSWVASHVAAFKFYGGAPRQIRMDNLKTGVLRGDIYDPQLNRAYAEFGAHYGVLLDPCRQQKPKDKPRVERAVPYVRDSFWRGRDFSSLSDMKGGALGWCGGVSAQRPHRYLPGTVGELFRTHEQPALLALPDTPFELARWAQATVHPDCHVQCDGRFFSVPWQHVGKQLHIRIGERVMCAYEGTVLVKTHLLNAGQRRYTDAADYPPQKVAFLQRTPVWCRRRAAELGPSVVALVDELLAGPHPLACLRQAQGIIRLADTYAAVDIDAACRRALVADGSLRTVRNILARGQHNDDDTHVSNAGAFLHGQQALLELPR
ncbi:MAG: IS21 family transposase [Candidatus Dormibacteria bacterium]